MHVDPQHDRSELVPRASRARTSRQRAPLDNVPLSATCASRQRAPLGHVRLSTLAPLDNSPRSSLRLHSALSVQLLHGRFLHSSAPQHVLCHVRLALFSSSTLLSQVPFSNVPRPLFGHVASAPPIARTRHPSPGRSSLREQADDEPSQRRSARAFWRETSPPPRRVAIRPSGSVTTRCTFDGECR